MMTAQEDLEKLRYPIGRDVPKSTISDEDIQQAVSIIAELPERLHQVVTPLNERQLATPYRPGGWSVCQVVHHLADSHMNAYMRCKLALTEDNPVIKPYDENLWAATVDANMIPVTSSLQIITGIHARWVQLINARTETGLSRSFFHPEHQQSMRLDSVICHYSWHSAHHLAHITSLIERNDW